MKLDKKVLVFDFDGTLIDSMGAFITLAGKLISSAYGISREAAESAYRSTTGRPFIQQLDHLFPSNSKNTSTAIEFEVEKKQLMGDFFPDVHETLRYFHSIGKKIAISSNNFTKNVVDEVQRSKLPCDIILGYSASDNIGKGSAHFQKIAVRYDVGFDDLLFVGDSLFDAKIAQDSGIDFIGKVGTFSREEFESVSTTSIIKTIDTIEELIHLSSSDITFPKLRTVLHPETV